MSAVTPAWLALREPADAAARAPDLAELVRRGIGATRPVVIHDLGAGTGSMARWLAPRLPGPQHWILSDQDAVLLEHAAATTLAAAAGEALGVETRRRDITRLTDGDLSGAALVTASALLDMLTADEVERVVAAIAGAGCPALLTLSVTGRVALTPPEPLDAEIGAAFNAHQRRGGLLGPDGAATAAAAFGRHGIEVRLRSTPWRLAGSGAAGLTGEWLRGWLAAACEQRPELAGPAGEYARRRREQLAAGRLKVVVDHQDLVVLRAGL
jgi:hypothetical protein